MNQAELKETYGKSKKMAKNILKEAMELKTTDEQTAYLAYLVGYIEVALERID